MNTYLEKCDYCHKEYLPTRRGVQRFCKDSCRSTSFKKKKELKESLNAINENEFEGIVKKEPIKIEKMSLAGVGNAATGAGLYDLIKGIAKSGQQEKNKSATKEDIGLILSRLKRYQSIEGHPLNQFGQKPYFDVETKRVVYLGKIIPFL